jgi:hypothetical protein
MASTKLPYTTIAGSPTAADYAAVGRPHPAKRLGDGKVTPTTAVDKTKTVRLPK